MKKNTRELILQAASKLVEREGIDNVTLTMVSSELGISHAALYKHFKNKQDLWSTLALTWLQQVLKNLFPFDSQGYTAKSDIVHDWLWELTSGKMTAFHEDPKMFKLYTNYIDENPALLMTHIQDLAASLATAVSIDDQGKIRAILQAFIFFSSPAFSEFWGPQTKNEFEIVWQLMRPGIEKKLTELTR